tara:strand:- start:823 stop:1032 length:210 start_codon:yes stop_codon:yes gene_type:complete
MYGKLKKIGLAILVIFDYLLAWNKLKRHEDVELLKRRESKLEINSGKYTDKEQKVQRMEATDFERPPHY